MKLQKLRKRVRMFCESGSVHGQTAGAVSSGVSNLVRDFLMKVRGKKHERENRDSSPALSNSIRTLKGAATIERERVKFRFFPLSAQIKGLKLYRCSFVFLCPSERQLEQPHEERRVYAQFQLDDDKLQHERWLARRLQADGSPHPLHCVLWNPPPADSTGRGMRNG